MALETGRFIYTSQETQEEAEANQRLDLLDSYDCLDRIGFEGTGDILRNIDTAEEVLKKTELSWIVREEIQELCKYIILKVPPEGDPITPQKRLHIGKFSLRIGGRLSPPLDVTRRYPEVPNQSVSKFPGRIEEYLDKIFGINGLEIQTQDEVVNPEIPETDVSMVPEATYTVRQHIHSNSPTPNNI